MEGINTILSNSILHNLRCGKAPYQLWENLQEELMSIRRFLNISTKLENFDDLGFSLEDFGLLPFNALLGKNIEIKGPGKEDAAQLIPGRIGDRVRSAEFEMQTSELDSRSLDSGVKTLTHSIQHTVHNIKDTKIYNHPITQSPNPLIPHHLIT